MENYNKFAQYYDSLTFNIDYHAHAKYYDNIIKKFGVQIDGILVDLACGTGSLSEEMAKCGHDVIGIDLSPEMLNIALDKKYESGLNIQYLCQDMCKLDLYGTIDNVICALDSINHLNSIEKVRKCFERVSLFLNIGGLFIFDVNTAYKHEKILADNTYIYDLDDVFCAWENSLCDDKSVNINLTFFEKDKNDCYHRYEESFSEYIYDTAILDKILVECGFEIIAHYDYMTDKDYNKNSEKITFVARKVS